MRKYSRYRTPRQGGSFGRGFHFQIYPKWTNSFSAAGRPRRYPIFFRRIRDKYQGPGFTGVRGVPAPIPLLETAVAFAAILLTSFFLSSSKLGFLDTQPHPFWFVIIFIPLLYGSTLGAFTGCVAFGLHLLFQITQCACPPDLTTPALMLLVAVCVGELRQRSLNRIDELLELAQHREKTVLDLTRRLIETEGACRILQQRISRETLTFASLYDFSKSLDVLDEARVWRGAAEVAAKLTEASVVSVWDYQNGGMQLRATNPQDAVSGLTNDCLKTSPILRQCLESKKTVSVRDFVPSLASSEPLNVPVVIAAPLLSHPGEVTGFVIIEKIDFFHFTPTTIAFTAILASWASTSLQNSRRFRDARDSKVKAELAEALRASTYLNAPNSEMAGVGLLVPEVVIRKYSTRPPG